MELHQLRYFLAVAETGNFTRAAERCAVAQPSLSQQIQKLEQELSVPLFDRLPRRAVLTEAGRRLHEHAASILASVRDAKRHVFDDARRVAGQLSIGVIPTIAPYLLPKVLKTYVRRYPAVEVRLQETVTDELLARLNAGALDLAVLALPVDDERLHAEGLFSERLKLALHRNHRLVRRARIRWSDLTDERFLVLHDMHCLGDQVVSLCDRHRIEPDFVFRGAQLATIRQMVAMGMGVSLIPEMAIRKTAGSAIIYRDIVDDSPARTIGVAWHLSAYRTNAARVMVDELRRRCLS